MLRRAELRLAAGDELSPVCRTNASSQSNVRNPPAPRAGRSRFPHRSPCRKRNRKCRSRRSACAGRRGRSRTPGRQVGIGRPRPPRASRARTARDRRPRQALSSQKRGKRARSRIVREWRRGADARIGRRAARERVDHPAVTTVSELSSTTSARESRMPDRRAVKPRFSSFRGQHDPCGQRTCRRARRGTWRSRDPATRSSISTSRCAPLRVARARCRRSARGRPPRCRRG